MIKRILLIVALLSLPALAQITYIESNSASDLTGTQTCNAISTQGTFAPQRLVQSAATAGSWAFSVPASSSVGTLFSGGFQAGTVNASTVYAPVSGYSSGGATEFSFSSVIGAACTARNAYVVTNNSNGVGTLTLTLRNATTFGGMADTALVVTVGSGAAAGTFSDTTHTVSLAAGSIVDWKIVMSANISAQIIGMGFQCN